MTLGDGTGFIQETAVTLDASKSAIQTVGNYDLVEKIAEGGMGTIYKGRHRGSGETVAIKLIPPTLASNQVILKRFENEFKAASSLNHPNIVRALEYGSADGHPYLVMEFVEGESLGQRLERDGKLPEAEAIRIISLASQGLHHAHKQGMIHRDVKPDNLMVTPDGQVKLADLGLVKELDTDMNLTKTGRGLGTPHFMAPEQFRNAKNADVRCDVYSLGATLYMMVTGELPFKSLGPLDVWMKKINNELPPPRNLVPEISERTDWAIQRAMSGDPLKRPESCREFVEDLLGHSTRKAPPPTEETATQELWYLMYQDEVGAKHLVKGSAMGIRRSLKDGLLGDASNVRVSRTKTGQFEPLRSHPEFRDLVITPAPMNMQRPNSSATPTPVNLAAVKTSPGNSSGGLSGNRVPTPGGGLTSTQFPSSHEGAAGSQSVPHIQLETTPQRHDLFWLLIMIAIAVGAGAAATIFLK